MLRTHLASSAILAALSTLAPAQDIKLVAEGGSFPGFIKLSMGPSKVGNTGVFLISITKGPTPLSIVDPRDPRLLYVGTESLAQSPRGIFLPPKNMVTTPPLPVPNNKSFDGATIYWHGIQLPGTKYLVGSLSNPTATRLAPKGTFRDRGAKLKTPRSFGEILPTRDHRWMIAGGGQGGILAQIALKSSEIYDVKTDTWVPGPDMKTEHSLNQATEMADGRWLITGGLDIQNSPSNAAEIWDPQKMQFTTTTSMNEKRSGHRCYLLPSGKILALGGYSLPGQGGNFLTILNSTLDTTEIYDPKTAKWTKGPILSSPRASLECIWLPNGKLLICGGVGWIVHPVFKVRIPNVFATCDVYDPKTNTISAGPTMITPRAAYAHHDLGGGKFMLAGGGETISLTNPGTPTNKCEIYDSTANKWLAAAPMKELRAFGDMYSLGNGKYINMGGFKGDLVNSIGLITCEIYDAKTDTWAAGPNLPRALASYASFETPMGQIQIIGGQDSKKLASNYTFLFYR